MNVLMLKYYKNQLISESGRQRYETLVCGNSFSFPRTFKSNGLCLCDYGRTIHMYGSSGARGTWHDEGFSLTGVRRSSSNGTYLPEQVPLALERRNRRYNAPPVRLPMQIPASWPGYYLYLTVEFSCFCFETFETFERVCVRFFVWKPVTLRVFNFWVVLQETCNFLSILLIFAHIIICTFFGKNIMGNPIN